MTKLNELANLGQSVWLDFIHRALMTSGELQALIDMGLRGMTSNPTIFEKAIAHSDDYDQDLNRLNVMGKSTEEIYTALTISDIQRAADMLKPIYESTRQLDGYVSLEVSPRLANDTDGTIDEAKKLWAMVDRPNLMIKIPATKEGLLAIKQVIASGINVNVTLIFSLERYAEVMEAYLEGLEQRAEAGNPVSHIASVASFFVSRLDTKIDKTLNALVAEGGKNSRLAQSLLGTAAVANTKLAYSRFKAVFEGQRFAHLKQMGARVQRPLWASTSTKNPAYSDILYVQELIGQHTVNTLPPETLQAFLDHGQARLTLEEGLDRADRTLQSIESLGISMAKVTQDLEEEGVASFTKSYDALLNSLAASIAAKGQSA